MGLLGVSRGKKAAVGRRRRRLVHEGLENRHLLAGGDGIVAPDDVGDTLETASFLELSPNQRVEVAELIGNNEFGPADVDLYSIELNQGDLLFAQASPLAFLGLPGVAPPLPESLFAIRLFDIDGNQVAISHNVPRPAGVLPITSLEFVAEGAGQYFVGISDLPNIAYDPQVAGSGEGIHVGGYALGLQVDRITTDIGDTIASAAPLPLEPNGSALVASFLGDNDFGHSDVDMLQFEMSRGSTLFARLTSNRVVPGVVEPRLSAVLRIFNDDGEEVAISPISEDGIALPVGVEFTAAFAGRYFLGVSSLPNTKYDPMVAGTGIGESSGRYLFEADLRRPDPSDDFGDTLETAEPLRIGPSGSIRFEEVLGNNEFGPNDVDLVRAEFAAGDVLVAHMSSIVPVPADIALGAGVLRVFDAAGEQLAVGIGLPTLSPQLPPIEPRFLNVEVEVIIPADGVYYVGASSFPNLDYDPTQANSGVGLHFGHYVLELHRGRIDPGIDVGDSISDATPIEIEPNSDAHFDEFLGNNRFGPSDVDIYEFELRAGDLLTSHFEPIGTATGDVGGLVGILRAFNAEGRELASSTSQLPDGVVGPVLPIRFAAPEDGRYYVGVSSYPNVDYDPNTPGSGIGAGTGKYIARFVLNRTPPIRDAGDTLATALPLPLRPDLHSHIDEAIGNNRYGSSDVDLYHFRLETGDVLIAHLSGEFIAAPGIGPIAAQGALRLFDAAGNELVGIGGEIGPDGEPHTELVLDFRALAEGDYFVGVSSGPNTDYDPLVAGSGLGIGLGTYALVLHLEPNNLPDDVGDTIATAAETVLSSDGAASITEFVGNNRFGPSDVDQFAIKLNAGESLAATLYHPDVDAGFLPGLANGILRAFDQNGNQIAISGNVAADPAGDFSNVHVEFTATDDAIYYVGVSSQPNFDYNPFVANSGVGQEIGSYLLDLRREIPDPVDDAGDTLVTATELELGPGRRLHLDEILGNNRHGPSDVDLYRFELLAGDRFRAQMVSSLLPVGDLNDPELRGALRVFDSAGTELAISVHPRQENLRRIRPHIGVEFEAAEEGAYYLGVSSSPNVSYDPLVAGSGVGESVGHYFLGMDIDRAPPTNDIGDQLDTAALLTYEPNSVIRIDEFIGNNRFGPADVDLFRIELAARDVVRATLRHPVSDTTEPLQLNGLLRLFDAEGEEVASSLTLGDLTTVVIEFAVPAEGTYFLGVSSAANLHYNPRVAGSGDGDSIGAYRLEARVGRRIADPEPEDLGPRNRPRLRLPRFWDAALLAATRAQAAGGDNAFRSSELVPAAQRAESIDYRVNRTPLDASVEAGSEEPWLDLLATDRVSRRGGLLG